jgi:SAM-dependent methyltransferase
VTSRFDDYERSYEEVVQRSIAFSGQEHDFFLEAKARRLIDLARRRLGDPSRVRALDVGAGTGLMDGHLTEFEQLEGVDVSEPLVEAARRANPGVRYHVADGTRMSFADATFDLTFCVCVLHHVPIAERSAFVSELGRVTRPGGLVVVFEHNPLNPLTRLAVSRCEFDQDAVLLGRREASRYLSAAGLPVVEKRYIVFFPWRGKVLAQTEDALAQVPFGAQYYVAAQRPSADAA